MIDVPGQAQAIALLEAAAKEPRHGYFITGSRGLGSQMIATAFIKHILQLSDDANITSHPDCMVVNREMGPKHLKKEISVEAIRELRRFMSRSSSGSYVVAYLPEAEYLNTEGVNALLKSIEEPASSSVFVLCSASEEALPGTLRSRLMRIPLHRVPDNSIREWLKARGLEGGDVDSALIYANGHPYDALAFLEDSELRDQFEESRYAMTRLLQASSGGEAVSAIRVIADECDSHEDPVTSWQERLQLWQRLLTTYWQHDPVRSHHLGLVLAKTMRMLHGSVSPRLYLELGIMRLAEGKPAPQKTFLPEPFPYPLDI